jgi:hypothetical protein
MDSAAIPLDSVTEDAITHGVPIPPAELPLDQRRAYLGGEFTAQRGDTHPENPYRDPGCAEAWLAGLQRMRKERGRA